MMRDYELVIIINPEVADEEMSKMIDRLGQLIATGGGEIAKTEPWGRRRLAYPIDGHREGFYVVEQFKMDPTATSELERSLRLTEDIIRYLLVREGE